MANENKPADQTLEILKGMGDKITAHETHIKAMTEKGISPEVLDTMHTELKGLKADFERLEKDAKDRVAGRATDGADMRKFAISKLTKAYAECKRGEDLEKECGYEIEVLVAAAQGYEKSIGVSKFGKGSTKKDVFSALNNTNGGAALPFQFKQEIIEAARSTSALMELIHTESLDGYGGFSVPIEHPKSGAATGIPLTSTSVQEMGALTLTATGFALANFTPRKQMMGIGFSNDFLKQGGGFVEQFVRTKAALDYKNKRERLILSGRGQEFSEPTGLLNRTDFSTFTPHTAIATNGSYLKTRDLSDMEISMAEVDRLTDNHKFLTRPGVLRGIKNEYGIPATGGDNFPLFPTIASASLKGMIDLLKYDIKWTTNVPYKTQGTATTASTLLYADFSNVWMAEWGPMEFMLTDTATVAGVSAFESDMTFMRFIQLYDMNIVRPDAFMKLTGLLTA